MLTLYPSLSLWSSVPTELSMAAVDFLEMLGRPLILGLFTLADMTWSEDLETLDVTEVETLVGLRSLLRTSAKVMRLLEIIFSLSNLSDLYNRHLILTVAQPAYLLHLFYCTVNFSLSIWNSRPLFSNVFRRRVIKFLHFQFKCSWATYCNWWQSFFIL